MGPVAGDVLGRPLLRDLSPVATRHRTAGTHHQGPRCRLTKHGLGHHNDTRRLEPRSKPGRRVRDPDRIKGGVDSVDAIASVHGVDCLFVGLSDLSVDLGYPAEYAHPELEAALDRLLAAARAHGVSVGIPIADLRHAADYRRRSVSFFTTSNRAMVANAMASFRASF
jgi:hypothetical protein